VLQPFEGHPFRRTGVGVVGELPPESIKVTAKLRCGCVALVEMLATGRTNHRVRVSAIVRVHLISK
jgi:hypothetical protein